MVVYRFKFSQDMVDTSEANSIINYLATLAVDDKDVIKYLPSKRDVILAVGSSIYFQICSWIIEHTKCNFEFEEHTDDQRALTQVVLTPTGVELSVSYMLPLFTPQSYLEL